MKVKNIIAKRQKIENIQVDIQEILDIEEVEFIEKSDTGLLFVAERDEQEIEVILTYTNRILVDNEDTGSILEYNVWAI